MTSVSHPIAEAPVDTAKRPNRIEAVDFVKGFLVAGMVIFHAINYFAVSLNPYLIYIKFVSGGFVLISGYTVATFYAAKWDTNRKAVTKRLITRGLWLIALFALINLGIAAAGIQNYNGISFAFQEYLDNSFEIFALGQGRLVAFEILLPIGYTILIAPLFLRLKEYRSVTGLLGLSAIVFACFTTWHLGNPTLLVLGVIGMLLGLRVSPEKLGRAADLPFSAGAVAVTTLFLPYLHTILLGYLAHMIAVLKFSADVCAVWRQGTSLKKVVLQYGKYSLLCYLAHIAILQVVLRKVWPHRDTKAMSLSVIIFATWLILSAMVEVTEWLRRRSVRFDAAYRFVFA